MLERVFSCSVAGTENIVTEFELCRDYVAYKENFPLECPATFEIYLTEWMEKSNAIDVTDSYSYLYEDEIESSDE